jgi:hypothetical protein
VHVTIKEIMIISLSGALLLYVLPSVKPYLGRLETKFSNKKKSSKWNKRKEIPVMSTALIYNIERMRLADIVICIVAITAIIVFLLYVSGVFDTQPVAIIITTFFFILISGLAMMVFGMKTLVIPLAEKLTYYYRIYWDRDILLLIFLFIAPAFPMIVFPESGWAETITVLIFIFLTGILIKEKSVWLGAGYVAVMLFVMMFIISLD